MTIELDSPAMTDIDNLIERLRILPPNRDVLRAADALDTYRKATGGLPPALIAKALKALQVAMAIDQPRYDAWLSFEDQYTLRNAKVSA